VASGVAAAGIDVLTVQYGTDVSSSVAAMANSVWTALWHAGITWPVILIGFSMGGYVAQAMAALAPARVRGIAFVCTSCSVLQDAAQLDLEKVGLLDVGDRMLAAPQSDVPKCHRLALDAMRPLLVKQIEAVAGYASSGIAPLLTQTITAPVLIVCGSKDALFPPAVVKRLADALSSAASVEVQEVADARHNLPVTHADLLSAVLAAWCSSQGWGLTAPVGRPASGT
jgi:3-oxoadipate enol-lactonase